MKFNYDNSYDDYDDSYPSALHGEEEKHINIALPSDDDNYDNSNDDDDNSHPSTLHGEEVNSGACNSHHRHQGHEVERH